MQQGLAAPGQAAEHVVEALPQPGLLHRGPDGGLADQLEGLPDPADLVAAGAQRRRLGRHVHGFTAPQPGHHVRQLDLGQLERVALQPAQAPDDAAPDQDGRRDRDQQPEQADAARDGDPGPGRPADLAVGGELGARHVDAAGEVLAEQLAGQPLPLGQRDRQLGERGAGRHRLFDVGDVGLVRAVDLRVEDGQVGGV